MNNRKIKQKLVVTLISVVIIYCSVMIVKWNGFTAQEWWIESRSGNFIWRGSANANAIALTFDDGPDPKYTGRILSVLKEYNCKATFFEVGRNIDRNSEVTRQVLEAGHEIGNHTYTHPYLERFDDKEIDVEINRCNDSLRAAANYIPSLFRAPRGHWNPGIYRLAVAKNLKVINWSVALEQEAITTPQEMADRVLRLVQPGGIILMHDGGQISRETTVQALPILLNGLKNRGLHGVTVSQLIKNGR